ncbi:MAG TPA: transglutaminase family protein [Planctomycetota bacterium]|nr:transglutaminase family protein [Planctomycetota bacterium]
MTRLRSLLAFAYAVLAASCLLAAEKGGGQVVVTLKSGAKITARLVAEDETSITISRGGGTIQFPRSVVERVEALDGAKPGPTHPPSKTSPTERPEAERPAAPGQWSEAEDQKAEECLTRYFTAKDDAGRKAAFAELEKTRLDRRVEDLERMRELAAGRKGLLKHLPVPWRKGADRGWFNLALPPDYTPAKAWPLVLALHGMPSDGDNLVTWYANYFPPRGYIVLFPTTIQRSSFWPAPNEKLEVLRLLRYISRAYRLDSRRIYSTGASGGGIGTWHWLVTLPELFAGGISLSAAGTIFDKRLEKLKGIPFYVHHGTADPISIESVKRSVEAARRCGATIEFYASEGTGHTPPQRDWHRAFEWLVKVPPKKASPRHLLESPEGSLPVGYPRDLPFAVAPEPAALAKLYASYKGKVATWQFPSQLPAADLVAGLAALARVVDPACDLAGVRREVKRLADAVRKKAKPDASPPDLLYALNETFFQTEGFARDGADPTGDSPEGHAIHRVLKDRKGSVFTLTGLYVAVAAELGLPVCPVVTPYHAFARYDDGKETVNVEATELGGEFDDAIYTTGYGLRALPSAATLKSKGAAQLLAAEVAALGSMARKGGSPDKAAAATALALGLDPTCFDALLLEALAARDDKQPKEAFQALRRAVEAWPDYAAPRLLQGELLQEGGSDRQAVDAYAKGIAARLKPYGAAAGLNAEFYYRTAAIYAPLARQAIQAQRAAAVTYLNKFNEAILGALKNNPYHPGARKLLEEMGGSVR